MMLLKNTSDIVIFIDNESAHLLQPCDRFVNTPLDHIVITIILCTPTLLSFFVPAAVVLTSFQIKVVMNDHRQNFNSHIYQIKNMCTNGRK